MKLTWRFLLGTAIGIGLGYAVVLLTQKGQLRKPEQWHTLYQAEPEKSTTT
ncbi:MAG: hypothetical protein ABI559_09060 [Chloroflexota bacterium]